MSARTRESIVEIEQAVADWSARLSRLEKEPSLESSEEWGEIFDAWSAMLVQSPLPDTLQIHPEIGLTWKKFDSPT